ncbi:hypothetical protein A2U01_0019015 [Trifolium medium]|uniref:Uncharacterized protein n=1 Tax=Trifolium medium TaxID=97028 RepID=A0A392NDS2_9FABA|nr:hypothetical protein [Trifolium medium]
MQETKTEGKCWDDSDEDEPEEYGNYALMAKEESSPSSHELPILTTLDITTAQYKKTVEEMSTEMLNIHTSMMATTEELTRLLNVNCELEDKNEKLSLMLVSFESVKQDNEYLKNKLDYAEKVEAELKAKLAENELKIKAYQNLATLLSCFHEKVTGNTKVGIGLDYESLKKKKHVKNKEKKVNMSAPKVLQTVDNPLFKHSKVDFDEEFLIIKQEIYEEDQQTEEASTPSSRGTQASSKIEMYQSPAQVK